MFRRVFSASFAVLALSLSIASDAFSFTGMYVFGDSLSDVGNLCPTPCSGVPVPPYAPGRFSNGPIWVDGIASALGFSLTPSSTGGNDYAVGGATSSGVLSSQVPGFLTNVGGSASPTALYVMLAGGNDGLALGDATTAANNVLTAINNLKAAGAQNFLVGNLPDLSLTPARYGNATAQAFTNTFNATLAAGLAAITGVSIFGVDLYAMVNAAVATPGLYGYTNVNSPCFVNPTVCATPNTYLFWDSVHPTTVAHSQLTLAALAAIPEPGTASLLFVGLLVIAARRRSARR